MQIIPARPTDAPQLTAIAVAAKRHWDYPLRWIEVWLPTLSITPEFIAQHLVYMAVDDAGPIGFYALVLDGAQAELEHLWVMPAHIGCGVGRALFEHAMRQAAAHQAKSLAVTADPNAEGFYLHMGARRIGQKTYMLEGRPRVLPLLTLDIPPL